MLTDGVDGSFAPKVALPAANLVAKPTNLSFEEAAGLGTAWLTAYRMLFTKANLQPGERVLVQGASGGVSTAAIMLAVAAGAHVTATSRKEDALEKARQLGAHEGVLPAASCPSGSTWSSRPSARPPGATPSSRSTRAAGSSWPAPPPARPRRPTSTGSSTGSSPSWLRHGHARRVQDAVRLRRARRHPPAGVGGLRRGREGARRMRALEAGEQFGKLVIRP